ncbi:MAG TPA: RNA methyltransferase substrate-binding domain-containing protein, partial [Bacillota bacterium]|nr:RNA methyltransferase substrate-binding domain-containing protein [Bacillota bacterium]
MQDLITSFKNQRIKEVRKLNQRKYREATGLCLVEGLQPVLRAMDQGSHVELLVVAPDLLQSELAAERIEEQLTKYSTPCLYVTDEVYESISDRDNPVGLVAVIR